MKDQVIQKIRDWKETFVDLISLNQSNFSAESKWWELIDRFETGTSIFLATGIAMERNGAFTPQEMEIFDALPYYADLKKFIISFREIQAFMTVDTDAGDTIYFLVDKKDEVCIFETYIQTEKPVDFNSDIFVYITEYSIVLCVEYVTEKPQRIVEFFQELNSQVPDDSDDVYNGEAAF